MWYREVELTHQVDPPGLLPDEVLRGHEVRQCRMVRADNEFPTKKVLLIFFHPKDHCRQLLSCDATAFLSAGEGFGCVSNHPEQSSLFLL